MGQKKPVRVINFVTSGSIEERILELLAFKKSVFAGALDEGGQDTVTVGESKLKALMRTVETMTQDLPQPDPAAERQKLREDARAEKEARKGPVRSGRTAASTPGNGRRASSDSLDELFQNGARFLSSLGDMLARPGEPLEKRLHTMIGKDDATGGAYVKIPLPETESIKTVFAALGDLLSQAVAVVKAK